MVHPRFHVAFNERYPAVIYSSETARYSRNRQI
jgi:hypothetical protein